MKKRLAIIGCGKIFSKHYEAIRLQRSKEKIVLVAICDPNEKLLNKINIKNIRKYKELKI